VRTILKWILKKQGVCELDSSGSRYGLEASCCEQGDEPSCCIKGGKFLDKMSDSASQESTPFHGAI